MLQKQEPMESVIPQIFIFRKVNCRRLILHDHKNDI